MRFGWLLCLGCSLHAQATLDIRPELITRCNAAGLGKALIVWESPGPGQIRIRVHSPSGPPMTGLEAPAGSAETGEWVRDGMAFVLVDEADRELATATAHVRCSLTDITLVGALAFSDYFPLQVGNEWVYRSDSRLATAAHFVWRVLRSEIIAGKVWYVLSGEPANDQRPIASETRYHVDANGRVFRMASDGREELWLDPTPNPDAAARLRVERRGVPFSSGLGSFRDSLTYRADQSLVMERGVFVRGVGLVGTERTMLSGSSGGFLDSLQLVYARLGDNLLFSTQGTGMEVVAESIDLDVSGRAVTNCAVPCYFVACNLAPGADPPGTYKPCFQTRFRVETPRGTAAAAIELALVDSSGLSVFTETVPVPPHPPEAIIFRQLPLYTAPNQPLAPGSYVLRARLMSQDAGETASTTLSIRIR